jgi:leader peptidase (prepilin peptidase)/N-methyltransferase
LPDFINIVFLFAFGASVGSFLNVVVYRLPRGQSLSHPPSRCPKCGHGLAWYDNIPVFGWLWLRGRCRKCREPISPQYPLIELAAGLMWAASVWYWGIGWTALSAAVFGTLLLGITLTDARHYVIPHEFTIGGLTLGTAIAAMQGWSALITALIGAATGFGLLCAIAWAGEKAFRREAMGGGDIWMMAMVGAFVGWKGVLLTVFLGAVLGTVVFVPLAWLTRHHPHWQHAEGTEEPGLPLVPFGIFLAAGAAVTFLIGNRLIEWYLRFVLGG